MPFAYWLMTECQPKVFVELGTHSGNSYFSFCQAVRDKGLMTRCYAVDTWKGDEQAGFYGDHVYELVNGHNESQYKSFSTLYRMTFDGALAKFQDQSVDLLHIDGLHTYEAVRHDFETWFPKLAPGALVLFHDIKVTHGEFGVWKFWAELKEKYPQDFEFRHSHGLGVIELPGSTRAGELVWLREGTAEKKNLLEVMSANGESLMAKVSHKELERLASGAQTKVNNPGIEKPLNLEVFFAQEGELFSEKKKIFEPVLCRENEISKIRIQLQGKAARTVLWRIDLGDQPGLFRVHELGFTGENGKKIWRLTDHSDEAVVGGSAERLSGDGFLVCSFGKDPQILLPKLSLSADEKLYEIRITLEVLNAKDYLLFLATRYHELESQSRSNLATIKVALEQKEEEARKAQSNAEKLESVEKNISNSIKELKEELIHELRTLTDGLNESQERSKEENLTQMDALRTSLVDRQRESENNLLEVAKYAEKIQDSVIAPSSYLIPAPFSWYSHLYKMLQIKKPNLLNKTSGAAPKRPGFWRRLERSIRKRRKRWIAGIGFDRDWYLNRYPDVACAGIDAFWHYQNQGIREGRFKNRKDEKKAWLVGTGSKQEIDFISDSESRSKSKHEVFIPAYSMQYSATVQTDIRAIALYLPQFHTIPENEEWWGKGFTEWTNVRRGKPYYEGHYQPHVPHQDLGYYDLNDPSVMEKQATMAKAAGIEGFCFYYYWFNGKRLLNMPTDRLLSTGKPDFPFCFCWANENWTRTWDGGDNEILMAQKHSVENDEGFICDLLPAFRDHRYIRVAGKPLLVVYRPGLLPNIRNTADRWREICRKEGIGEIHLAFMLGFEGLEPASIGFDSAIQMPPLRAPLPDLKKELKIEKPEIFKGEVRDYLGLQRCFNPIQISKSTWPAVCPSWDNTVRRMERAHSFIHSSPENYLTWLQEVVEFLRKNRPAGERIIFINAWNEWGEGCHLEPDEKYGYAWLNATRFALTDIKPSDVAGRLRVLVVGHDAWRNGAQILLLTMLREWKKRDDVDFRVIFLGDGPLRSDFQKICPTMVLTDYPTESLQTGALQKFCDFSLDVILANTVVSGSILPTLKHFGVPIVSYIHELQKSIDRWAPGKIMETLIANTNHFIAGAKVVATNLNKTHRVNPDDISTQESFIKTCKNVPVTNLNRIRKELGLQLSDKVVLGCGTMDWRKGPDIFARTAERVLKNVPDAKFIWIGPLATDEFGHAAYALARDPQIRFIGEKENFFDYFLIGSAFFLSSREDPYPLVALEAADAGLPIVCFAEAGGIPDFVTNSCGRTVPLEDIEAAAQALTEILTNRDLSESLGRAARNSVRIKHDAVGSSEQVLSILKQVYCKKVKDPRERLENGSNPLVSVVVPNYNHARFLPERITSIIKQTYSNIEIIFLDDNSTDESIEIIEAFVARDDRGRVLKNDVNSGSSFKQWRKGLREAKGKYVWIAESDDSAHPDLLQGLVARLEASDKAVLATCCPRMTSLEGNDLGIPRDWFADIGGKRWESDFSSNGKTMIAEVLSKKNAILNASGVVFRNGPQLDELADDKMRLCGDWLFWVRLLARGDFEYVARPLNYWRLGSSNARTKPAGEIEWIEGKKVLHEIAKIMGTSETEKLKLLALFKENCESWNELSKLS